MQFIVGPTTPLYLYNGLGSSRFARTTLGISLISIPVGTKIFQFPTFASDSRQITLKGLGLPIQTSPVHRSLGTSPKLIAALPRLSSPLNA